MSTDPTPPAIRADALPQRLAHGAQAQVALHQDGPGDPAGRSKAQQITGRVPLVRFVREKVVRLPFKRA
jgi:hypothetical protein